MLGSVISKIKARKSSEWNNLVREKVLETRELIREQGEVAAVVGFIIGVSFILLFKLWLILIGLAIISYAIILVIADS